MKRIGLLPLALTIVVTLGCNMDGRNDANIRNDTDIDRTTTDAVGTRGEADNNREFVSRMLDANMTEVELGRMAQNQAASADVKRFAEMMVTDHSKSLDTLKPIANRQGTPLVAQLDDEHRELRDRLAKLRGAEFDREYMRAMVDGHEEVINQLQTRANEDRFGENKGTVTPETSDDPMTAEINQWAAMKLPTTRHHLDEAKRVNDSLGDRQTRR
jgi:putative membrane protein